MLKPDNQIPAITVDQRNSRFPSWPFYSDSEISAVVDVLRSGKVNQWTGDSVSEFEIAMCDTFGRKRCVALSNGTVSLEIALRALRIGAGDEVIVTPRSFIASVSCVVNVGATPVFADIDQNSQNLTAQHIEQVLTSKTKAVIPVHLAGWPCEMNDIVDLAKIHDISVIEDCAQSHGATYHGKQIGSFGEMSSWSFCQNKIISTGGEGGALATDSTDLWERIWSLKEHGKSLDALVRDESVSAGYRWLHDSIGSNYRMTGIQAAIGTQQLLELEAWVKTRRANAETLWTRCGLIDGIDAPDVPKHIGHACYIAYVNVDIARLKSGWDRDRILSRLLEQDIPVSVGCCPELYKERAFERLGIWPHVQLPIAHEVGKTSLAFQTHPLLNAGHMHEMADALQAVMIEALR